MIHSQAPWSQKNKQQEIKENIQLNSKRQTDVAKGKHENNKGSSLDFQEWKFLIVYSFQNKRTWSWTALLVIPVRVWGEAATLAGFQGQSA